MDFALLINMCICEWFEYDKMENVTISEIHVHTFSHTTIRGDVKIHRLQLPYSAASCSHLIWEKYNVAVECCCILAAASGYESPNCSRNIV